MYAKLFSSAVLMTLALSTAKVHAGAPVSPCAVGQIGAGTNCMFLTTAGAIYDAGTGNRSIADAGMTIDIEVWIDFGAMAVQGGGFDISYNTAPVMSASWSWTPELTPDATLSGAPGASGYEGIQFDDFSGAGYGGTTGSQPAFLHIGTLTVTLTAGASISFGIAQPYTADTFPNCFAPGAFSGGTDCVATNFYSLMVDVTGGDDSDADGVPDFADNCTLEPNSDQRDTNGDGFGNLCDGDFDGDCAINFPDLQTMKDNFFGSDPDTDLDGSGMVNFTDLNRLKEMFFGQPGPSALASCP